MNNIIIEISAVVSICFIISVLWKVIIVLTSTGAIREIEKSEWLADIFAVFFVLIFFLLLVFLFVFIIKLAWV